MENYENEREQQIQQATEIKSHLHVEMPRTLKSACCSAAYPGKLADFVIEALREKLARENIGVMQ